MQNEGPKLPQIPMNNMATIANPEALVFNQNPRLPFSMIP
jgi:hypothetical protein